VSEFDLRLLGAARQVLVVVISAAALALLTLGIVLVIAKRQIEHRAGAQLSVAEERGVADARSSVPCPKLALLPAVY
jgi:hypothetical protein